MIRSALVLPLVVLGAPAALSCNNAACVEECYETCDLVCDAFGCWEACFLDCYCVDTVECLSDRDCGRDDICASGECLREASGEQGLCESCSSHDSCVETDALCVTLPASDERVCGRGCRRDSDCPADFSCVQAGTDEMQCIPSSGACGVVAAGCTSTRQCDASETCEGGVCVDGEG